MDVMGGVLLQDGSEAKVVTGIDDHSRFCVAAGLVARATSKAVCEVFTASLGRHGIPDEVLTDNLMSRFMPYKGSAKLANLDTPERTFECRKSADGPDLRF
jgi:hypothetical protein